MKARSAYIHLPFCKTKCPYCDFASEAISPVEHSKKSTKYIDSLLEELEQRKPNLRGVLDTIYFGGGTPSLEQPEGIAKIITKLSDYYDIASDAEITLEANPGTVDKAKLLEFRAIGINRISVGAQTFDEGLLQKLGRGHSLADTDRVLRDIAAIDFNSWSLDLIYGLPGQTIESWQATLDRALEYQPPHISAYALSIEPTTPYGAYYKNSKHPELPVEDDVATMYEITTEFLAKAGLPRYEISNWAKPGHESRHNLCYWLADEYLAVGVGAHGFLDSRRYANPKNLNDYYALDFTKQETIEINAQETLVEKILLGLRLERGIDLIESYKPYIRETKLNEFIAAGLVKQQGNSNIKLTDRGILLSNRVIAELIEH